jgi:hypothetical protein
MDKPQNKDILTIPGLVGAYAIAGLFIQRALRGSSTPLGVQHLALVGGTSAVSSYLTPMLTSPYMCQRRPMAPFLNAVVSSGLAYTFLRVEGVNDESAMMFVPIQLLSTLLAYQVAYMINKKEKKNGLSFQE